MKYSLMSLTMGNLLKVSKPSILQLNLCKMMGFAKEDPSIAEVIEFLNSKGIPMKNGDMSFEDLVKFASEAGYDAIDFMSYHFEIGGDEAKAILDKYNMKISGSCIIAPFINCVNDEQFDKLFAESCEVIDRLAKAGCKNLLLMPTMYTIDKGISEDQAYANMIKGIKACMEYAKKLGIVQNLETLESSSVPLGSDEHMARFFNDVPELKYAHDTGNLLVANMDPAEMYEKFKDRVATVHFKDFNYVDRRTPSQTPDGKFIATCDLGTGLVDFKKQLQLLKRDNYQGYILLEGAVRHFGDSKAEAIETLKYFKDLEAEVG
ncbi:MAG: sugar phosphate isomerase/epimerase [Oscillospiraceae bacterium]|nr:sugar phosphate isomerase/epimerase [Oscillospiraceae bacterium]